MLPPVDVFLGPFAPEIRRVTQVVGLGRIFGAARRMRGVEARVGGV